MSETRPATASAARPSSTPMAPGTNFAALLATKSSHGGPAFAPIEGLKPSVGPYQAAPPTRPTGQMALEMLYRMEMRMLNEQVAAATRGTGDHSLADAMEMARILALDSANPDSAREQFWWP